MSSRHPVFELSDKITVVVEALAATGEIRSASRTALAEACDINEKPLTSACNASKISISMQTKLANAGRFDESHFSWIDTNIPLRQRHLPDSSEDRRDTAAHFRRYLFQHLGIGAATQVVFQSMPGDVPLGRLGNLDVSAPNPLKGANIVHTEEDRRQAIGLSVKPIFGTLRNEELFDPNGNLLAIADIEAGYVLVLIETADPYMDVIGGIGVDGEQVTSDAITCRYLGKLDGRVQFEISAAGHRETLAGTSQTFTDIVALEGTFRRDDWIGIGIDNRSVAQHAHHQVGQA